VVKISGCEIGFITAITAGMLSFYWLCCSGASYNIFYWWQRAYLWCSDRGFRL